MIVRDNLDLPIVSGLSLIPIFTYQPEVLWVVCRGCMVEEEEKQQSFTALFLDERGWFYPTPAFSFPPTFRAPVHPVIGPFYLSMGIEMKRDLF